MPQPLSRVHPTAGIDTAPDSILSHPELATIVAHTIAISSDAELQWPLIAAVMNHGAPQTFVAIHTALTSSQAQRAMVGAVASAHLGPDDLLLFKAVEKATKPARDIRNAFAHHIWGVSVLIPDALTLVEPGAFASFAAGVIGPEAYKSGSPPDLDRTRVMVYRKFDLERARDIVKEAWFMVHKLRLSLDENWPIPEHRARKRKALSSRPAVAQALHTLAQKRSQEAHE